MREPTGTLLERVRALLGRARLVYWDDVDASAEVKESVSRLSGPLAVEVRGAEPARSEVVAVLMGLGSAVRVADRGDASIVLPDAVPNDLRPETTLVIVPEGVVGPVSSLDARGCVRLDLALAVRTIQASDAELASADEKRADLEARSGLVELRQALADLDADGDTLRAVGAMGRLGVLLSTQPRRGSAELADALEQLSLSAHEPRELAAAVALRVASCGLPDAVRSEALGILSTVSGRGAAASSIELLARWRTLASEPTLPRRTRMAATAVARVVERQLAAQSVN